jgi:hypothetical protein
VLRTVSVSRWRGKRNVPAAKPVLVTRIKPSHFSSNARPSKARKSRRYYYTLRATNAADLARPAKPLNRNLEPYPDGAVYDTL